MFFYENRLFGDEKSYEYNVIENFNFHPHFHRSCEVAYIMDGEMEFFVDDKSYLAKKGDVVVTFPNQIHSHKTEEYSKMCLVIFSPELIGHFLSEYNNLVPCINIIRDMDIRVEEFMTDNIYLQKAVLYKAVGTLVNISGFERANISGDFKLIHKILSFVEENYNGDCSLKTVAKVLKYDYAYLSKQFIKTMNMSYTEYLNRYRITQACYFINNDNIPISEVYAKCGFENARSFNRNFKKYTDITPTEYKVSKR